MGSLDAGGATVSLVLVLASAALVSLLDVKNPTSDVGGAAKRELAAADMLRRNIDLHGSGGADVLNMEALRSPSERGGTGPNPRAGFDSAKCLRQDDQMRGGRRQAIDTRLYYNRTFLFYYCIL